MEKSDDRGSSSPVVITDLFVKKNADGSGIRDDQSKDLAGIDELLAYFRDVRNSDIFSSASRKTKRAALMAKRSVLRR